MQRRIRWGAWLLVGALLMTACTTKDVEKQPPPVAEPPTQKPEPTPKPTEQLPLQRADGVMESAKYAKGEQLPGPGLYFMETASGQIEGWRLKVEERWISYEISPDNHWIQATAGGKGYLTDRSTGQSYTWDAEKYSLLAISAQGLLFHGGGTYHWLSPELSTQSQFAAPAGSVLLAPNGELAAILHGTYGQRSPDGVLFYLADLKSGQVRPVGKVSTLPAGTERRESTLTIAKGGTELVLSTSLYNMHAKAGSWSSTRVERFDWDGRALGALEVNGVAPVLSPDGKLIAWQEMLDGVIPTLRVADAETGQDRFRILGAAGPLWEAPVWLAGGERFLIGTQEGPLFVSNEGKLTKSGLAGSGRTAFGMILPAPDNANLFTNAQWFIPGDTGPSLLDSEGRVLQQVKMTQGKWRFSGPTWGETSKELRFSFMVEPGGDGWDGVQIAFPAKVEFPPYAERFLLQVKDPKQECLNLRAEHNRQSKVLRCLPTGTKLALADATGIEPHWNLPALWDDSMYWAYVETEAGEKGWVSLSTESMNWAE